MIPTRKHGPPSAINAGLLRTGTLSMARAYDILGLRTHHFQDVGTSLSFRKTRDWYSRHTCWGPGDESHAEDVVWGF
jgi:hypothetical protein